MTDRPIEAVRNLGPRTGAWLREIGVSTEAELKAKGAIATYRALKSARGGKLSLNALYAMQAGIMDIDWRELPAPFKQALREEVRD